MNFSNMAHITVTEEDVKSQGFYLFFKQILNICINQNIYMFTYTAQMICHVEMKYAVVTVNVGGYHKMAFVKCLAD